MSCLVGSIRVKMLRRVHQHGVALLGRAEEFDPVELPDQVVEEGLHLVLRGPLGTLGHGVRQLARRRQLEPFIADQQHGLGEVERGKTRIDREGDDAVGEPDLLVGQPPALAAEQDTGLAPYGDVPRDLGGGSFRPHHRLGLVMGACGGGEQQVEIGDGLFDRAKQFDLFQNVVGAGRGALGGDVGPAVAGVDDAQAAQGEVAHGARGHADVFAKLRLDQDHDGTVEGKTRLALVSPRHLVSLSLFVSRPWQGALRN
ncbi:hypothetical protein ABIE89_007694 [Bradyrhizobium niftali]